MSDQLVDPQYLEQCMVKGMMVSKDYLVTIARAFEADYFDSPEASTVFTFVSDHFQRFKEIPNRAIITGSIPASEKERVESYLRNIDSMELDIAKHHDWLFHQTDMYMKDKAIKDAVRRSVEIIDRGQDTHDIRALVEAALCKNLKPDIGISYFDDMNERLRRMFTDDTQRLKTYFPVFDDFINGGFPPKTLSVFVAKIHGFKSNVMANMIARQVLAGKNIALASLEMSEDMFSQRFDGIYSQLDINRFYFNKELQRQLVQKLKQVKAIHGRGNLFIKSFPTGKGSVNDFRTWVRELKMRGHHLDGFFFDYLNLMKSVEVKSSDGATYGSVKSIAEETRAMGFEFDIPMISVSQLNRGGTFMSFADVDFNSIAESMGVPATADFMMIMGANDEEMVYNNEVHYKIVKNRLGGRVGEMDKFYYDARSLKMYCSSELELWMEDVRTSGDDRNVRSRPLEEADEGTARGGQRRRRRREE